MKKIFAFASICLISAACVNLDYYRSDTITTAKLHDDPSAAVYTTDGLYSMLKDRVDYNGKIDGNNVYIRQNLQMTEFRGDNICLSGRTTDPLYEATTMQDNANTGNNGYFWMCSYKIIYGANANIEGIREGTSTTGDMLLGENYFLRAYMHLMLLNLYCKPYSLGIDNPGVILQTSTTASTSRATVGKCYEQVAADLEKAADLLAKGTPRHAGDNGYVTAAAAKGLLSRVYLYMGKNEDCIRVANEILGEGEAAAAKLDESITDLYQKSRSSREVLWCVDMNSVDLPDKRGSVGSMYYSPDGTGGTGWCEIYASDPLLELFNRYPQDKRYTEMIELYNPEKRTGYMVNWPVDDGINDFRANAIVREGITKTGDDYSFSYGGKSYTTTTETENTYPIRYITYNGQKTKVFVHSETTFGGGERGTYPMYMVKKFVLQDGNTADPMVSSPILLRYGEVILNRAEAEAKTSDNTGALRDVNIIRKRAGLSGEALFTDANRAARGYSDILDMVLDERRLELCFEGHRAIDQYRNKKKLDRRYGGVQKYEVVDYNDPRIQYYLPYDETSVSGISQNPDKK